ncbi:MAG: DUF4406 domain-containing protein [Bacteroidales bacterium]|nr:DUF4406 domain-containing protein [Bacteroidales bacterium]
MKKVYIAGKVTGEKYQTVFIKFMAAENRLKMDGHEVVNPIRFCASEWPWADCMRRCIARLMECDAIYLLNDWKQSKGARLEKYLADQLGLTIMKER